MDTIKQPFNLQDDEKIVTQVKPQKTAFMLVNGTGYLILAVFMLIFQVALAAIIGAATSSFLIGVLAFIILVVLYWAFAYFSLTMTYDKYEYWITNQRVVGSRGGIIGYSINSIPLEMVADVIVNRTVVDRMLNLSTLTIMPVGSQGYYAYGGGSSNYLQALQQNQAMALQKQILDSRNKRKK